MGKEGKEGKDFLSKRRGFVECQESHARLEWTAMSAAQVLTAARTIGIHVEVDGNDLLLEAVAPPPSALLEALSRHKAEIIAMLRPGADGWSTDDWRLYFEERAAVAEFNSGLTHADAEAQAFECCIIQWMNRNPSCCRPGSVRVVWQGRKPRCRCACIWNRTGHAYMAACRMLACLASGSEGQSGCGVARNTCGHHESFRWA